MNQEVLFASTLEKIRKQAKEQGNCIEENQVRKAFEPLHLEESQMQMVFDYLVKHKVGIGTPVNPDEYLSEEERDYLQDYLKELEALKGNMKESKLYLSLLNRYGNDKDGEKYMNSLYTDMIAEKALAYLFSEQNIVSEMLLRSIVKDLDLDTKYLEKTLKENRRPVSFEEQYLF